LTEDYRFRNFTGNPHYFNGEMRGDFRMDYWGIFVTISIC
jgi:hypothetical protein